MKNFIGLLSLLLLLQCQSDGDVREKARTAVESARPSTVKTAQATNINGEPLAPGQTAPTVETALTMILGTTKISSGKTGCIPVSVEDFSGLIGLQYSIRWNPEELVYQKTQNFQLAGLSAANFGADHTDKGVLAFSWIDMNLKGVHHPDNQPVYEVCFSAKAPSGTTAAVTFEPRPVPYEVIDAQENILQFVANNGSIVVE